jgi:hypothetical protein
VSWSGRNGASLRHSPLRTVRASFLAHGSSKSLHIRRFSCRCCVDLLVAVEVYELQVGLLVRPALAFRVQVMAVEGFSVEERSSTVSAPSPLAVSQADEPGWQLFDLSPFAPDPVAS